jgi:phosphoserine aminotransferase
MAHEPSEVLRELTVYDGVEAIAVCLISTRLLQRAVGDTVALGVTHVGSADAATVRTQELLNTCAVLTWHMNASS